MKKRKNVTIKDIANELGYSVNTVSCALNGRNGIKKETAAKIKKKADELDYIPNSAAVSMRTGRTNTIAVIIGDVANAYFSIMVKEIERNLRGFGYVTIILVTDEDEDNEHKSIMTAIAKKVDAVILFPACTSVKGCEVLKKAGVPFVLVGRHFNCNQMDYVISDDIQGGYLATLYLLNKGHKRILIFTGSQRISCARERYEGYVKAHKEMNVEIDPKLVVKCGISMEPHTVSIIDDALVSSVPFSAVFTFNDLLAYHVCTRMNESYMGAVEVVGYDNLQSHVKFGFNICSVDIQKALMAKRAVEIVIERINSKEETTTFYNEVQSVRLVNAKLEPQVKAE